jgi:hypothetical protein
MLVAFFAVVPLAFVVPPVVLAIVITFAIAIVIAVTC